MAMVAYMYEFLPGSLQDIMCTVLNMSDACVLILQTIFYRKYQNWLPIHNFYFLLSCSLIIVIMTFPESPKFNYVKKRYGAVRSTLEGMARFNMVKNSRDIYKNTLFEMEAHETGMTS